MAKRKVYSVEKRSSKPGWKEKQQGGMVIAKSKTKAAAVKDATQVARKDKRASVVIRKANGRIQEERTYPRGSDPSQDEGVSDVPSERDRRSSETEEKGPGVEPFEGEGGSDTGPPHETTPPEQSEDDSGTGANNQGAVQRPDQH